MQVLTVDVGTGTQDIFLYDSDLDLENGYKMVVPSPTMLFRRRILQATAARQPVCLSGVLMGGGPVTWAARDHVRAGLPLYSTPNAARTFDDDLDAVQQRMGITLIGEDEIAGLPGDVLRLELQDFDFDMIRTAFDQFGYRLAPDMLAVAVFDHGAAPAGVSDRQFRFDYLADCIRSGNKLSAFAHRAEDVPAIMTRMAAVVESARNLDLPLLVMDTAPAAVLGATLDPRVEGRERLLVGNIGNFHCLVFRLGPAGIEGVFEHHTGEISPSRLDELISRLADGSLTHQNVFEDKGHGALLLDRTVMKSPADDWGVIITGPRRSMTRESIHRPYYAVPFGDMMVAGCYGMLAALPKVFPEYAEPVLESLKGAAGRPPWELT